MYLFLVLNIKYLMLKDGQYDRNM